MPNSYTYLGRHHIPPRRAPGTIHCRDIDGWTHVLRPWLQTRYGRCDAGWEWNSSLEGPQRLLPLRRNSGATKFWLGALAGR